MKPNYKKIYTDIINKKDPSKLEICKKILSKKNISAVDIILVNDLIFSKSDYDTIKFNHKHRSYDKAAILSILDYQKKENLNNSQLAIFFNLSRNTVARWKKLFQ